MSIGGAMRTSVSGMNAQTSRLGAVSDNIANSDTTGYKQSEVEFSSLVLPSTGGTYNSGAVESQVRTLVTEQGGLAATGNNKNADKVDLAISGNGFLVVDDGNGGNLLTRAGSFTKQNDGTLVNAAGYVLKGYPISSDGTSNSVLNGFDGLEAVNLETGLLSANPSTSGVLTVPLNMQKVAGVAGTVTQSTYFNSTGPASPAAATVKGDQLVLNISVDGGTSIPVTVTSKGVSGINSITGDQIVDAINSTQGLEKVASLVSGALVLKSNSGTIGTSSSIQLVSVTQVSAAKPATVTQAAAFSATGGDSAAGAPVASIAGDKLVITISIDGTATPVTVTSTGATGIDSITGAQIVAAINGTTGLSGVASLDATNKLVLTSNGTNVGTASTIQITSVAQVAAGGGAMNADATLTGLGAGGSATTGTASATLTGANATTITGLTASASATAGTTAVLPSANTAAIPSTDSTVKASITVYTKTGEAVPLDVYYTKTDSTTNTWEMTVFDRRNAATGTSTAPFPYGYSGAPPLAQASLTFDNVGKLASASPVSGGSITSATSTSGIKFNLDLAPIGGGMLAMDIGNTTQFFDTKNTPPLEAKVDGNPAEVIDKISVGKDGRVTAVFTSGTTRALYDIPLAKVNSPNSLSQVSGNAFQVGVESGSILMGTGSKGGFGDIIHGSLEESTVDLASQLTTMITAQRSYTANSKVFQTGSEILDVLVNLVR